ncbi:MAG: hypothetical protein IJD84_06695 [Parabacteroides sp.]|nr:hypothetical protein [Parabacteroides sp.]
MDELIRQIQEMSINDFEQQLHIHFSRLKKETDKLKIYIALLLLAKESLDTIKELNIEGLILHLKEKVEKINEEYLQYAKTIQMQISENDKLQSILLKNNIENKYQDIQKKINELLLQQEQILKQAVTEREQHSFESIITENG